MDRMDNKNNNREISQPDTGNDTSNDFGNESRNTEIEQPNPSIATPGIPPEMPARDIR